MRRRQPFEEGSVYPAAAQDMAKELGVVHALCFLTPDPLNHCARALDVVRRMGFDFIGLQAGHTSNDSFLVQVKFLPVGVLSPQVLAERVSTFVGVSEVELQVGFER